MKGRITTLREMEYDNYSVWKRHAPWGIRGLIALILFYASLLVFAHSVSLMDTNQNEKLAGFAFASYLIFGVGLFFLLTSFGKMRLAWRRLRRANGHFTKSEKVIVAERRALAQAQYAAIDLASDLLKGTWRPLAAPWNVVVQPGEQVIATAQGNYSRFYGTDATYMHSSGFFMGNAAFVLIGFAATAFGNRSRRRQAEAIAQEQWREQQSVYAVVTNQRILCQLANGTWLSFYYGGITSLDIDSATGTVIVQFPDTQPLMLGGTAGLFSAVALVWVLQGRRGLEGHPGLEHLRRVQQNSITLE